MTVAPGTRTVRAALTSLGNYSITEAETCEEALSLLRYKSHTLVLLDWNVPSTGDLETCGTIRTTLDLPVVVLSSATRECDKVEALDAGADDYIVKPCGVLELLARIRARARRQPQADSDSETFTDGDLEIDFTMRRTSLAGKRGHLSPKEHDVLRFLVNHSGRPVAHRRILQAVWGPDYGDEVQYLRVIIRNLRSKIEPMPSKPRYLLTESRVGYCFATNR
jgi:two-component system, OmpR family, KDP operon response regulator KdpE